MIVTLSGSALLGKKLDALVKKRGHEAAAKAVALTVRRRMLISTIPASTGVRTGRLRHIASWPVRSFSSPRAGAGFSTTLPYAARLNYSKRKGPPRHFLEKAVQQTRHRWQAVAIAAWRRERAR